MFDDIFSHFDTVNEYGGQTNRQNWHMPYSHAEFHAAKTIKKHVYNSYAMHKNTD